MKLRALLLLLAMVMVWSGQGVDRSTTVSASHPVHHHEGQLAAVVTNSVASSEGSSLPMGQATHAVEEAVVDLVGLLADDAGAPSTSLLMSWPGPYPTVARIRPYLDGLKRPPRATPLLA